MSTPLERMGESLKCSICLSTMTHPVRVSCPALHAFDRHCAATWLANHQFCPMCKENLPNRHLKKDRLLEEVIGTYHQLEAAPLQNRVEITIPSTVPLRVSNIYFEIINLRIAVIKVRDNRIPPSQESIETMEFILRNLSSSVRGKMNGAQSFFACLRRDKAPDYNFTMYGFIPTYRVHVKISEGRANKLAAGQFDAIKHQ